MNLLDFSAGIRADDSCRYTNGDELARVAKEQGLFCK